MSKAFSPGESADDEERIVLKAPVLPPGTPNFITPEGAERLEAERQRLIAEKAALGDGVDEIQRAKTMDRRLEHLTEQLNSAKIVAPSTQPVDRVQFGATVTVQPARGDARQVYRIVGIDEIDLNHGAISWISPLAKGLIDKKVGDTAVVGEQQLTILSIRY
jgi:transcription elongation factor GreB